MVEIVQIFVQAHSLNVSQQRLVRQGPAKTTEHRCKNDGSDTDHWGPGGVVYFSEFEDNDADLLQHLKSNSDFIVAMTGTAAFTDTTTSYLIFLVCLFLSRVTSTSFICILDHVFVTQVFYL